jgi:PAS domain S-box-containing protein
VQPSANAKENERLQSLRRYDILDSPPESVFDDLTALAADVCEVPISLLTFLDQDREWFKSKIGVNFTQIPRGNTFAAHTIRQRDLVVIPDVSGDNRFASNPLVTGEAHIRFYAGYPIMSPDGHGLGTLCVMDRVPHELNDRQQQLLCKLGHEMAMLLELRREAHETQHRNERQVAELNRLHERLMAEKAEHKIAEEGLARRERQLADAQRLAQLGSWEWDIATGTVTWSDELYRIFGVNPGEFPATYEAYLEHVHPDDRAKANALIKATLQTCGSFIYEKRIVRPDGATRILYSTGEVIVDEHRKAIRMVGCAQDITSRKEIEEKLESTVSLLHSTLESTADGILVVDPHGRLLGHNQRFLDLWHIPAGLMQVYDDNMVLQRVLDQMKDPDGFLMRVRELYSRPEEDSFDLLHFKDGRIFERYSRPQRVGDKIVGRVWSFRDVTERCQALETLRASEQRYRSLVIATAQVVWTTTADGRAVHDNATWCQFTGQTAEEFAGEGWMQAVHPKDRARVMQTWRHSVADRKIYEIEFRLRRADGEWRNILSRGVPVLDDYGNVREWVGCCFDLTERKETEQRVLAERDFSEALIKSVPGIFYLLDENGCCLRFNKNFEAVTEYSGTEIEQMHAIDFIIPEERSFVAKRIEQVFRKGDAKAEVTLLSKSGKRVPFYCTGKLVHVEGRPRLLGIGLDISKRKAAEDQVQKLNQELESRIEERTQQLHSINNELHAFSYTVSHDLKAPLRAIAGFAEAIAEDCSERLDEEHRSYLQRVVEASQRMTQLIEDLLTYSRIGQAAITLRPVSLNEVIEQVASDFTLQFDSIGGKISIAPDLPTVVADRSLLAQVFGNLFENAITYRKKNLPLEVCVTVRQCNDGIVVCVTDNGIGIDPAHHERIFDIFQRLHQDYEHPGTGIGLANVKKAMQLQGGSVWVESEVDQGSTFCVRFNGPAEL